MNLREFKRMIRRRRRYCIYAGILFLAVTVICAFHLQRNESDENSDYSAVELEILSPIKPLPEVPRISENAENETDIPNYNVHAFYYPWYGNTVTDGHYYHWAHEYLPHWDKRQADQWAKGHHRPPHDIGANFYPLLGCYSSADPTVIRQHMQWMRAVGIGVVVVSWFPPGMQDGQGQSWEGLMPAILDAAERAKLKVAIHVEPYKDRDAKSLRQHLTYIMSHYAGHPSFYHFSPSPTLPSKPLIYIYDSYLVTDAQWKSLLKPDGRVTVRGTKLDAYFIGLIVKESDKTKLQRNGFDGLYTYFAVDGFTFGSRWRSWANIRTFARKNRMIFIPSIGPGYVDTRVRPWNSQNIRSRDEGRYYESSWLAAINSGARLISITSFNEWHEGTQIEPAVPKFNDKFTYLDYGEHGPFYYLNITRKWIQKWKI